MPVNYPTEAMCDAARDFLLSLQMGCKTYDDVRENIENLGGTVPDWMDRKGHLTKWDVAECIYLLMEYERVKE